MRSALLLAIVLGVVLVLVTTSAFAETYTIASSVQFADKSGVTAEQRADCSLDTRLPKYIAAAAGPGVEIVISTEPLDAAQGKVLHLEIEKAFGSSKKMFRVPASIAVRGELKEYGELTGTLLAFRWTNKIAKFDGYKGECARLGRCLEIVSRDIATWLRKPTMDAKLGDL